MQYDIQVNILQSSYDLFFELYLIVTYLNLITGQEESLFNTGR